jgi:hypothetical protein
MKKYYSYEYLIFLGLYSGEVLSRIVDTYQFTELWGKMIHCGCPHM